VLGAVKPRRCAPTAQPSWRGFGLDRACAQRVVCIYVMAELEWLTLTKDFREAYSAGISLVS
jgi:hypothetical protein